MTKKTSAEQIRDLTADFAARDGAQGIANTAGLVGGINDILADAKVLAALEVVKPEQAAELRDLMAQMRTMQALTAELVTANAARDGTALERLRERFQNPQVVPNYEPETLDPPYDVIDEAISDGDIERLRACLAVRPDLNVLIGKYRSFPLAKAAMMVTGNRLEVMTCLLEHGADPRLATPEGYTALHFHVDSNVNDDQTPIVDLLLLAGADIEARNHYGWTPMLQAVIEGSPLMLKTLLARGANVHARFDENSMPPSARGCTAMMAAIYQPDMIEILLDAGADPAGRHEDGRRFNAYADDLLLELEQDDDGAALIERSRTLVNSARLH